MFSAVSLLVLGVALAWDVGVGIFDITGPAAEIGFMGYGSPTQIGAGIHYRLHARAFVFVDSGATGSRFAFVNIETAMIFHEVKVAAIALLQQRFGSLYDFNNTMISATHTHSGPGGFTFFPLYDITTLGYHQASLEIVANGIVEAIAQAHGDIVRGASLRVVTDELVKPQTNINRSPWAYLFNPPQERAQFAYDVDKNFTLVRIDDAHGQPIGSINWFAVHGTSMNNTNVLVSGDNKGHAMYLLERMVNGNSTLAGRGPFVAAFCQANEGDVSPNTLGPFCPDGQPCEFKHSTCNGKNEGCRGIGPGTDMFDATRIIGQQQAQFAASLLASPKLKSIGDGLRVLHQYVDFSRERVSARFSGTGQSEMTCPGALGDAFAAGTTDGCGMFDFRQGTNSSTDNPYWNIIGGLLHEPNATQIACQYPKPILLDTGEMTFPCPWSANVLPLQLVALGRELVIIGVPAEFTTMAGRRLRRTVRDVLDQAGFLTADTQIVISGLSNQYSHYVATREEYGAQRYEGASTMFGPFTLAAYQQRFTALALALVNNDVVPPGPTPNDYSQFAFDVLPPVVADSAPGGQFGAVRTPPLATYIADDTDRWPGWALGRSVDASNASATTVAVVEFWGADPRGHPLVNESYVEVQRQTSNGAWQTVLTDNDWDTQFLWRRYGLSESIVTAKWHIYEYNVGGALPATFRIVHRGYFKHFLGVERPYEGATSPFVVLPAMKR